MVVAVAKLPSVVPLKLRLLLTKLRDKCPCGVRRTGSPHARAKIHPPNARKTIGNICSLEKRVTSFRSRDTRIPRNTYVRRGWSSSPDLWCTDATSNGRERSIIRCCTDGLGQPWPHACARVRVNTLSFSRRFADHYADDVIGSHLKHRDFTSLKPLSDARDLQSVHFVDAQGQRCI